MKMILGALILAAMHAPTALPAAAVSEHYRLREGDAVLVSVWREDALQKEVRVLPDGSLTFPLAGRIPAAGATAGEVALRLTEKLRKFISDPEVSVVVTGIEGNRVYVLGRVNNPGAVVLDGPMTVLQALSRAGGLDTFASGNAIQVLRKTKDGDALLPVHYGSLIKGRSLETNVLLMPGDTILVP